MERINKSHPEEFILLGFADRPWLELPLFIILLLTYPMAMVGNIAIILVSTLDSRLHSPMYFFLTNLSFLDMCYTTSIVPQICFTWDDRRRQSAIWAVHSALFLPHNGRQNVCFLALMSFDRYVAICKPLHYTLIMNRCTCILLVALVAGGMTTLSQSPHYFPLVNTDHLCEIPVLISACGEKGPMSSHSLWDQPKFMALFYGVVTPTLNPFIYTLRNKDVKGAWGNLVRSIFPSK
ncbi:olfactory receptor 2B11-like [Sus scrofa]|uniref:olfactory receptor 2B11-like n=1 Tax=Sus scrofa TaxID=9823 RepID=UPI000A2B7216|nr:olfactory receptor 2B11-like [Sus scrofa]